MKWSKSQYLFWSLVLALGIFIPCWAQAYEVQIVGEEYRCYDQGHHFMTVRHHIAAGIVSIRTHPGCDINGWGSTWYPVPFTQSYKGEDILAGRVASVSVTATASSILVDVTGQIYHGTGGSQSFGSFEVNLMVTYYAGIKQVLGSGTYNITVYTGTPTPLPADLNLYRLHSNFLCNVQLQSGGTGDTGDTTGLTYFISGYGERWWYPPDDDTYPQDPGNRVYVIAPGDYNEVDNIAQGFYGTPTPGVTPTPIAAAYKPSLRVELYTEQPGVQMYFGAAYAMEPTDACNDVDYPTCECKQFWRENVSGVAIIHAPGNAPTYYLSVTLESNALPGDPTCPPTPPAAPPLSATSPGGLTLLILIVTALLCFTKRSI